MIDEVGGALHKDPHWIVLLMATWESNTSVFALLSELNWDSEPVEEHLSSSELLPSAAESSSSPFGSDSVLPDVEKPDSLVLEDKSRILNPSHL